MTPDTAALRALADAAEQEGREEAERIAEYRRRKWFEPRWDWQYVTHRSALAEALRDPATVRALCDGYDEAARLRVDVERTEQAFLAAEAEIARLRDYGDAWADRAAQRKVELEDYDARLRRAEAERDAARERANEAARLSSEARDALADAERRWEQHQDVCVMASLDRENLETERDAARAEAQRLRDEVEYADAVVLAAVDQRIAARQALAALVADLRSACDSRDEPGGDPGFRYTLGTDEVRAVIDRHAPATPTTEEDR